MDQIKYRPIQLLQFFLIPLLFNYTELSAQKASLDSFIDSATAKNPDLIILTNSIKYKSLEIELIKAENNNPKMYLSADYLFAPYFNNNGKLVSVDPSAKAVGYDVGITNGGLYSALYNVEYPLFNRKQTAILVREKEVETEQINNQIELLKNELKLKITNLYYEAYRSLIIVQYTVQNVDFLNKQLDIVKQLTEKGIFRYVDYKLMEIELHSNKMELEKLKSDYITSLNALRRDCGITDSSWTELENREITLEANKNTSQLFTKSYTNDSLSAVVRQNVFNCRYKPQLIAFANTGLNAITVDDIQRRFGVSAGLQLTYTFYDGNQKRINWQKEQIIIDQASKLKELKTLELQSQSGTLKKNIELAQKNLVSEKEIITDYENIISICQTELQQAQISIIDFLNISRNLFEKKLNYAQHQIDLDELIGEYNYWEH